MYIICSTSVQANNVYIIYVGVYISTKVEKLMQIARTVVVSQKDRFDFINTVNVNGVNVIIYQTPAKKYNKICAN